MPRRSHGGASAVAETTRERCAAHAITQGAAQTAAFDDGIRHVHSCRSALRPTWPGVGLKPDLRLSCDALVGRPSGRLPIGSTVAASVAALIGRLQCFLILQQMK